jgi:tetratricopeptide (TPR) repeat protein
MPKITTRHAAYVALTFTALPGFAAEATSDIASALALQEHRELTLASAAMAQKRPDIACQTLQPSTPLDSRDVQRLTLLGRCSSALGRNEEAATYYQRVIVLSPQAPSPRVELARVYLAEGKGEEAARLFDEAAMLNGAGEGTALMQSIAERLRNNDPAALAAQQGKPWSVQLYTGVLHDDNANAGPISRNVPAVLGGVPISFELVPEAMPKSSFGAVLGMTGSYIVPLDQQWALMWQGAYFGTGYFSAQEFNNDSLSLSAAFIYRNAGGFSASIQPNLRYVRLDGRVQEQTPGVTTRVGQQLNKDLSLTASLGWFDRSMPVAHERDAQSWFGSAGASWQAATDLQVGGEYIVQRESAAADVYSKDSYGPSLFASYRFTPEVSAFVNYAYLKSQYDEKMDLFPEAREDTQKVMTLTGLWDISKWAGRNMVVRAQYSNIDNPSNIAYNSFKRNIVGVGVQMMF